MIIISHISCTFAKLVVNLSVCVYMCVSVCLFLCVQDFLLSILLAVKCRERPAVPWDLNMHRLYTLSVLYLVTQPCETVGGCSMGNN